MKNALRIAFRASVAAVTLAFSTLAMANPTVVTSIPVVTGSSDGFFGSPEGSAVLWELDTGPDEILVFSIAPTDAMNTASNSYAGSVFAPSDNIKRLYETFYPSIEDDSSDPTFNGAFQVVLWELNNDDGNLETGNLYFSGLAASTELALYSQALLTFSLGDTPITNAYAYTQWNSNNPPSMALLSVSPVPEPGSWAMLAAGLGILGAAARRKRSA
jgi:hypothetical protein